VSEENKKNGADVSPAALGRAGTSHENGVEDFMSSAVTDTNH
jgi:hypothetical protein